LSDSKDNIIKLQNELYAITEERGAQKHRADQLEEAIDSYSWPPTVMTRQQKGGSRNLG
jgi:hypothetical protein